MEVWRRLTLPPYLPRRFGGMCQLDKVLLVTPKWGLDKRGLGNQSFLQKSLKNIEEQPKIVEKSYKIDAKTTTQGGGAKRRPLGAPPKAAPVVFCIYFV